eukprot:gene1945-1183_t
MHVWVYKKREQPYDLCGEHLEGNYYIEREVDARYPYRWGMPPQQRCGGPPPVSPRLLAASVSCLECGSYEGVDDAGVEVWRQSSNTWSGVDGRASFFSRFFLWSSNPTEVILHREGASAQQQDYGYTYGLSINKKPSHLPSAVQEKEDKKAFGTIWDRAERSITRFLLLGRWKRGNSSVIFSNPKRMSKLHPQTRVEARPHTQRVGFRKEGGMYIATAKNRVLYILKKGFVNNTPAPPSSTARRKKDVANGGGGAMVQASAPLQTHLIAKK